jgi:hypothetical protein
MPSSYSHKSTNEACLRHGAAQVILLYWKCVTHLMIWGLIVSFIGVPMVITYYFVIVHAMPPHVIITTHGA